MGKKMSEMLFFYGGCKIVTALVSLILCILLLVNYDKSSSDDIEHCCVTGAGRDYFSNGVSMELTFYDDGTCGFEDVDSGEWVDLSGAGCDDENFCYKDCRTYPGCAYDEQTSSIEDGSAFNGRGWLIANCVCVFLDFIPVAGGAMKTLFNAIMVASWGQVADTDGEILWRQDAGYLLGEGSYAMCANVYQMTLSSGAMAIAMFVMDGLILVQDIIAVFVAKAG